MPRRNKQIPHQPFSVASSCQNKRRFGTKNEALQAAAYQMNIQPDLELTAYKCPRCHNWHLTSSKTTQNS